MSEPAGEDMREQLKRCTHDLNNVLGQVLGFSSLLVRDIGDANADGKLPAGLVDYAQELLAAGMRGEGIAKQLTAIVRALPPLPVSAAAVAAAQPPSAATPSPPTAASQTSGRRVLIAGVADAVDDPRAVAFVEAGWQVETHLSGADALRRFRAAATPFDVVIAYPATAEVRGADLIAAIKALRPATVRVLILGEGIADEASARLAGADAGLNPTSSAAAAIAAVDTLLRQRRNAA